MNQETQDTKAVYSPLLGEGSGVRPSQPTKAVYSPLLGEGPGVRPVGPTLALFTGTFDPFTVGHQNIAERALRLFDRLVIAVAVSKLKNTKSEVEQRVADIRRVFAHDDRVEVLAYSDLTIDLAARVGATCIVRGVRNVRDFEWEREQADINRQLCGIETLLLFSEPQYGSVSSTLVRELRYFGRDVSQFLPE